MNSMAHSFTGVPGCCAGNCAGPGRWCHPLAPLASGRGVVEYASPPWLSLRSQPRLCGWQSGKASRWRRQSSAIVGRFRQTWTCRLLRWPGAAGATGSAGGAGRAFLHLFSLGTLPYGGDVPIGYLAASSRLCITPWRRG
jgi:hypothetical protein